MFEATLDKISKISDYKIYGKVTAIKGLMIEAEGLGAYTSQGSKCSIINNLGNKILCEVIALQENKIFLMPFSEIVEVSIGCRVEVENSMSYIYPTEEWRGRILNALGEAVDEKGILAQGQKPYAIKNQPIPAHKRKSVGGKIDLGVKAVNLFTSCCLGQRLGIFAGSGVGKSMLISMLTKYSDADIKVIGLVGERGRELKEFLDNYLGEEGLKNAVIIVATSDESALMRRQAAYLTLSVAEYFRDIGKNVLCLLDSVTRFAMAQREIGLSVGEPPATRGYTPSVFAEMPKLLERAGPGAENSGNITGLFTVLVEGDDHNEPISDTVRGILDGHIIMDRKIAERGRYPAIDVLKSVSRTMPACNSDEENKIISTAKNLLSTYNDMAELIRLGAYRKGSDVAVDNAIKYFPKIEAFLNQNPKENMNLATCYQELKKILES
ncbi:MAG: flagellar protein export ATPase FliI [Rickettsiales bacterium]|nr:flagellar protein export ATPase FliI [Rickettsiales bacterium]